jgi:hypothetical protein
MKVYRGTNFHMFEVQNSVPEWCVSGYSPDLTLLKCKISHNLTFNLKDPKFVVLVLNFSH